MSEADPQQANRPPSLIIYILKLATRKAGCKQKMDSNQAEESFREFCNLVRPNASNSTPIQGEQLAKLWASLDPDDRNEWVYYIDDKHPHMMGYHPHLFDEMKK